jgi:hypothetical protein
MLQRLDAYAEELFTAIVLVVYLTLPTCFRCTIASAYQLPLAQSIMGAAREVYSLKVGLV